MLIIWMLMWRSGIFYDAESELACTNLAIATDRPSLD